MGVVRAEAVLLRAIFDQKRSRDQEKGAASTEDVAPFLCVLPGNFIVERPLRLVQKLIDNPRANH